MLYRKADREINICRENNIEIVYLQDNRYSSLLAAIPDPPFVLYCKGRTELLKTLSLAVIGTRSPTPYGIDIARRLTSELAQYDLTIVSGLAVGIDAVSHATAIERTGRTIAVLGCGLDQRYPASNLEIRKSIEERGLVLCLNLPGIHHRIPVNFPRRNRIISGLSLGTLLIEAREGSGALITVNEALDQGREIFAVPGPITSPSSLGPLRLIQQGAYPVINSSDIIDQIPQLKTTIKSHNLDFEHDIQPPDSLDPEYLPVWRRLGRIPVAIDDIIVSSSLPPQKVQAILLQLELMGLIRQLPGNQYVLKSEPPHQ